MNLDGETRCTLSSQRGTGPRSRVGPEACRRKFVRFFPKGFRDAKYISWEREYKWTAHEKWDAQLGVTEFTSLLQQEAHLEIARRAAVIESRTNLLFSFEKMALRDALRDPAGARIFASGLFEFLHGDGVDEGRF